jgi:hypothetical protein
MDDPGDVDPSITSFDFLHDPSGDIFHIAQRAAGAIGAKLYPGALLLCAYLRAAPLPAGSAVVELGAGVCGLPSLWLSRSGARVIATDAPAMLPLLVANVARAGGGALGAPAASAASPLRAAPFEWGVDDAAAAAALRAGLGGRVDYVVAADVVYHDPLIAPLLGALRALTDAPPGAGTEWAPPVILLSYVQRFKRARRFFKLAAAHFDVVQVAGSARPGRGGCAAPAGAAAGAPTRVVDYDALTWALPKALRVVQAAAAAAVVAAGSGGGGGGGGDGGGGALRRFVRPDGQHAVPLVRCDDVSYDAHCALLEVAASCCAGEGEGAPSSSAASAAAAHGAHRVGDSDSGDEWLDPQGAARAWQETVGAGLEAACSSGQGATQRAAVRLGVPFAEPAEGSVWELRRRRAA